MCYLRLHLASSQEATCCTPPHSSGMFGFLRTCTLEKLDFRITKLWQRAVELHGISADTFSSFSLFAGLTCLTVAPSIVNLDDCPTSQSSSCKKSWPQILTVIANICWGLDIELLSTLARRRCGLALRQIVALIQLVIPSAGRQSIQEIGLHGSVYGSLRSLICIFPQITRCTPADCFVLLTIKKFLLCFSNSVYICSIMSWHMGPTSHRQVV